MGLGFTAWGLKFNVWGIGAYPWALPRLLVAEWANVSDGEKEKRDKRLQDKIKSWDSEISQELAHLNKIVSPMPKRRQSEATLDEGHSEDSNKSQEEASDRDCRSRPAVAKRPRAKPVQRVKKSRSPSVPRSKQSRDDSSTGHRMALHGLSATDQDLWDSRFKRRGMSKDSDKSVQPDAGLHVAVSSH